MATLPIAMKSIAESRVCLDRFKNFLLLPEYEKKFEDEMLSDSEIMCSIVFEDFNAARELEAHDDDKEKEGEKLGKFFIFEIYLSAIIGNLFIFRQNQCRRN